MTIFSNSTTNKSMKICLDDVNGDVKKVVVLVVRTTKSLPPSHEYPLLLGILCKKERFDQKCHVLTSHLSSFDHGIDDL